MGERNVDAKCRQLKIVMIAELQWKKGSVK